MKIALIGTRGIPPNYGGTETYVEQLALHLASFGDEVWVYGEPLPADSDLTRRALSYPSSVHRVEVPTLRTKHADNFVRSLCAAVHVCFQRQIEIVQFNNVGPAVFSFLPRLFGKKVVGAVRALDARRGKWGPLARAYLRVCESLLPVFAHALTTNSKAIAAYYRDRYGAGVHYTPNGAIIPRERTAPCRISRWGLRGDDYLLFVGRLVPEKGCQLLIEAFRRIAWPGMKLVFAGNDNFASEYAKKLKRNGSDSVLFVGHVNGEMLEELYDNAYAFVLPSSIEGMSNSLLSAMAHGRPVVVSDIAENVSVVEDAPADPVTGMPAALTFRLGDAADLAAKLERLRDHPEETKRRGECLRAHALATFSWEHSARQTREIYAQLLAAS